MSVARELLRQPQIFGRQRQRKAGFEVAAQVGRRQAHLEAHHLSECGFVKDLDDRRGIDPSLYPGGPAFGHHEIEGEARAVVHDLGDRAGADAVRAGEGDLAALKTYAEDHEMAMGLRVD